MPESLPPFSVVSSFSARMSKSKHQAILHAMEAMYPEVPFFIFHENSWDERHTGDKVEIFNKRPTLIERDLFLDLPWVEEFLATSPFRKCATIEDYWNRHSIYWFRKVMALYAMLPLVQTPLLLWLDCDCGFRKPLDKLFFDHWQQYDASFIFQPKDREDGLTVDLNEGAIESGIIPFNMAGRGEHVIKRIMESYRSGEAFKWPRWDDGATMTYIHEEGGFSPARVGGLTMDHGAAFNAYDYIFHYKGPMMFCREDRTRFSPLNPAGWIVQNAKQDKDLTMRTYGHTLVKRSS